MIKFFTTAIYFIFVSLSFTYAADEHDHKKEDPKKTQSQKKQDEDSHDHGKEKPAEQDHADEHSEEDGHDHSKEEGDEHGEHGEENPQVGPDKGILEANEDDGIKLSPEAEKNFGIEKFEVFSLNSISIEKSALVTSGVETNLYRYRNGFYKRIDFTIVGKFGNKLTITSKDLSKGDSIVTRGLGFILTAEIAAFGGAPTGHSH